jgi:hypothetical protein
MHLESVRHGGQPSTPIAALLEEASTAAALLEEASVPAMLPEVRTAVTVRVLAMLEIYFVSVNYVFVSIKLMCVCVKFLKI